MYTPAARQPISKVQCNCADFTPWKMLQYSYLKKLGSYTSDCQVSWFTFPTFVFLYILYISLIDIMIRCSVRFLVFHRSHYENSFWSSSFWLAFHPFLNLAWEFIMYRNLSEVMYSAGKMSARFSLISACEVCIPKSLACEAL